MLSAARVRVSLRLTYAQAERRFIEGLGMNGVAVKASG